AHMPSTEQTLRLTVAALMRLTGERQADLADGLRLNQAQVSRKQGGSASWSLDDIDRLSAHYGIPVCDLLAGVDRAVRCLPARRYAPAPGAAQLTIAP
ncbi:helix-turn-helix domain-containing protein, partial [Streptomyces drozdowiczii]